MKKIYIFLCCLTSIHIQSIAQEEDIAKMPKIRDSLKMSVPAEKRANLLLDLALGYIEMPGEDNHDLDTALLLIKQARDINGTLNDRHLDAKGGYEHALALREKGDTLNGHILLNKALAIYKTLPEYYVEFAYANTELTIYFTADTRESFSIRRDIYRQSYLLVKKAGLKMDEATLLMYIADFDQLLNEKVKALMELKESLALFVSAGHSQLQGVYDLLGSVYSDIGDYANAVKYGLLSLQAANQQHDTSMQLCTVYYRLGVSYSNWGRLNDAIEYLRKAMAVAIKYDEKVNTELVLRGLTTALTGTGRPVEAIAVTMAAGKSIQPWNLADSLFFYQCYADAYLGLKDYAKAGNYVAGIIALIPRFTDDRTFFIPVYRSLVHYYMAVNNFTAADKYVTALVEAARYSNRAKPIGAAYHLKASVDSAMGNYKSAFSYFQAYQHITDSTLNEETAMQFAAVQADDEVLRKSDSLKINHQNIQLLQSNNDGLKKAGIIRNIIIGSTMVMLAILYIGYRFKQRNNTKLKKHQDVLVQTLHEKDKLVIEKEWLVKEIHHRVKNNLQIIISLLNAQAEYLDNPTALQAIQVSRERMQAIAIIHQKLHALDESTLINMQSYIQEMVANLRNGFLNADGIYFQINVEDIYLDISQSVPLGLILNEAITNAVKYAWQGNKKGTISVSLKNTGGSRVELKINDDGKGFPAGFDANTGNSLGIQLIQLFAEQLEGSLQISNNNGAEVLLAFNMADYKNKEKHEITSLLGHSALN